MPNTTPYLKVKSTKEYVGKVVLHNSCYDYAYLHAKEIELSDAFLTLCEKHKLMVEASGATSLAALKKLNIKNKTVVPIISGGNIDILTISSLINDGLVENGRLFCFSIELPDSPGQLHLITKLFTNLKANVVKLEHNHYKASNRLRNVLLEVTVETNGLDHIDLIKKTLFENGYNIVKMY